MMGQTGKTYEEEVEEYSTIFTQSEEEEWLKRRDVLNSLKISLPDVYKMSNFIGLCEVITPGVIDCIKSERTQLCIIAMEYAVELSHYLKFEFDPLASLYLPVVLKNCGRTNKIIRTKAHDSLIKMLTSSGPTSWFTTLLEEKASENKDIRFAVIKALQCIINLYEPKLDENASIVEDSISSGISDASPEVRDVAFDTYCSYFAKKSSKEQTFREALDPITLKTLEKLQARKSATTTVKSDKRPSIASLKKQLRAKMQREQAKESQIEEEINTGYPSPPTSTKSIL
ncbi:hypothetical protein K7432_016248 [Basidiobolus ranarum]|uniref:TOG domain-containing protein n=1 Tax=Basidiobolus ranarum TaxID=34480 RepID=A0ABR2WEZ4_9FUNG